MTTTGHDARRVTSWAHRVMRSRCGPLVTVKNATSALPSRMTFKVASPSSPSVMISHNLFVLGAGAFPQNAAYNPTDTVCALAYFNVDNVIEKHIKNPGQMT
jgi:hypothetical protein